MGKYVKRRCESRDDKPLLRGTNVLEWLICIWWCRFVFKGLFNIINGAHSISVNFVCSYVFGPLRYPSFTLQSNPANNKALDISKTLTNTQNTHDTWYTLTTKALETKREDKQLPPATYRRLTRTWTWSTLNSNQTRHKPPSPILQLVQLILLLLHPTTTKKTIL